MTDYVVLPMVFSDGRINVMTLATDGFTTAELRTIAEMLPVLARLMEVHALRRTAQTVLETYLGHLTGERVLAGLIHRGEGEDIHAVIWLCDLPGSTALADRLPRRAFLELLNDYFECMAGAVLAHRGEVLKFIGDAMLAIFPIGAVTKHPERCPRHGRACADALAAAREAMRRMADLNRHRAERREPPLRFGIALHLGDVMYGSRRPRPSRLHRYRPGGQRSGAAGGDVQDVGAAAGDLRRVRPHAAAGAAGLTLACTRCAVSAAATNCSRWRRSPSRRAPSPSLQREPAILGRMS